MLMYILGVIAVILTAIFIVVRVTKGGLAGVYTKTIASVAFIVLGLFGAYTTGLTLIAVFTLLGLICGMLGDIVLDLKVVYRNDNDRHLNAGMLCFGVGHIMYFVALTIYALNSAVLSNKMTALILIPLGGAIFITSAIMLLAKPLLKLNFGKFKIQTALYTFALSFMTIYAFVAGAFVTKLLIFAVGLLLIFLSDLILSNQYFGGKQDNKLFTILNHAIYYLGQITIAVMLFFM